METVLIIEDEKDLADLIAFHFRQEGYRILIAADGIAGLDAARAEKPSLILLDIMLPGMTGTEICRALKMQEKTADIPIVMLTAKGEEIDRVVGFEVGADDYIVKPFSTRELLLRARAILRRARGERTSSRTTIKVGAIIIDTERHTVRVDDEEILLTTTEYKLLLTLCERPGRVQSRDSLLVDVWGYNYAGDTRTVDTHVTRLRSKLGAAGELIMTVRGFGYKLEAP